MASRSRRVGHTGEDRPQVGMHLRQARDLSADVGERAGHILGVVLGQRVVEVHSVVELAQHAAIVDDVAAVLALGQAVDAGDRLKQRVLLERLVDVEHGVARLVEAGQQLIDHDQHLGAVGAGERADDLFDVGLLSCRSGP